MLYFLWSASTAYGTQQYTNIWGVGGREQEVGEKLPTPSTCCREDCLPVTSLEKGKNFLPTILSLSFINKKDA